jgi:hypothetical protein
MEPSAAAQDPVTAAALASVVTAFLMWLSGKGWPLIKEALGLMGTREKAIADSAKEGPIMVLERVERELKECKESLDCVLEELKDVRQKHFDCERKYAAMEEKVKHLEGRVDKQQ